MLRVGGRYIHMGKLSKRFIHYDSEVDFQAQLNSDGFEDDCIVFVKDSEFIYHRGTQYCKPHGESSIIKKTVHSSDGKLADSEFSVSGYEFLYGYASKDNKIYPLNTVGAELVACSFSSAISGLGILSYSLITDCDFILFFIKL